MHFFSNHVKHNHSMFFFLIVMLGILSVQVVHATFFKVFNISKLIEVLFNRLEHVRMIIRVGNQACSWMIIIIKSYVLF